MYLADNNVFGVDLNPIAVELAEVSIWLNALSQDRFIPWLMPCPAGPDKAWNRQPNKARTSLSGAQPVKKLYWHSSYGLIEVEERLFRAGSHLKRPFSASAAVRCRGVSGPLQRVVTDFGADYPFRQVTGKLQEHYGITLPHETARHLTGHHGRLMLEGVVCQTCRSVGCG